MKRRPLIAAALVGSALFWIGLLSLLLPGAKAPADKPASDGSKAVVKLVDKSAFNGNSPGTVTLRMDITNPSGKPLTGLGKADLRVVEDGTDAEILDFRGPGTQALSVFLVMDVSGSMAQAGRLEQAKQAAITVLDLFKTDRDRLGIIVFDDRHQTLVPFGLLTADAKRLAVAAIGSLSPRGGTRIGPPAVAALDALADAEGSRMVMVMTDGEDPGLVAPGAGGKTPTDEIAERSDRFAAPVYTVSFGDEHRIAADMLRNVAVRSHGTYEHAPDGTRLAAIYQSQIKAMSDEFVVVYRSPSPSADGLPRNVEVQVKTASGQVTAGGAYQIGPMVAGAARQSAAAAGQSSAAASVGGFLAKVVLFVGIAAALVVGLFASTKGQTAVASGAPSPTVGLSPAVPPPPPPPPAARKPPIPAPPTAPPTVAPAPQVASPVGAPARPLGTGSPPVPPGAAASVSAAAASSPRPTLAAPPPRTPPPPPPRKKPG